MDNIQKRANRRGQASSRGWRLLARWISGPDSPHWVALGFALGWWMSLIPFDSLFFYVLAIAIIVSPANLLACMITFVGGSLLSNLLVGSLDALGNGLLTIDVLQPFYRTIIEWPFVAWTRFNNTVVLGGLVVGAIGAVPLYLMARLTYRPFHDWLESRCGKEAPEMESIASSRTSTPSTP